MANLPDQLPITTLRQVVAKQTPFLLTTFGNMFCILYFVFYFVCHDLDDGGWDVFGGSPPFLTRATLGSIEMLLPRT